MFSLCRVPFSKKGGFFFVKNLFYFGYLCAIITLYKY